MKKILLSLITAAVLLSCQSSRDTSHKYTAITPGVEWLDTNNEKINAHGGGILYHEGIYYWYGECKSDSTYWNPNGSRLGMLSYGSRWSKLLLFQGPSQLEI